MMASFKLFSFYNSSQSIDLNLKHILLNKNDKLFSTEFKNATTYQTRFSKYEIYGCNIQLFVGKIFSFEQLALKIKIF